MEVDTFISNCKQKVDKCLNDMVEDLGWNRAEGPLCNKMVQALKCRRPLVDPEVYFKKHSARLDKLMRTNYEISRTDDLDCLSQDGKLEHRQLSKWLMDQGCRRLFMSCLSMTDFVFAAKIDSNRSNGYCTFGDVAAIVNLPLGELKLESQDKLQKWCESCQLYLVRSTAQELNRVKTYQLGALENFLSDNDCLKLKPDLNPKRAKSSSSSSSTSTSESHSINSFVPTHNWRKIDGSNYLSLNWNDLRAVYNDKFKAFKEDARNKKNHTGTSASSNQEKLVAKKYYNLVITFNLPTQNVQTKRATGSEFHKIENLRNYVVSPELVLEMHTKLDIDPDGFYLWKLCFGENFNQPRSAAEVVDLMLMPRYRGVLTNAYELKTKKSVPAELLDRACDQTTRTAMLQKCFNCPKLKQQFPTLLDTSLGHTNLEGAATTAMINADQLVSEAVPIQNSDAKTRVWNWFGNIFNAIDLQRSGRESSKDTRAKLENFGVMILDGFHFGMMSREEAERVLKGREAGTFLLRFSNSMTDCCNLVSAIDNEGCYSHGTFAVEQKESVLCRVLNLAEKFNFRVLNKRNMQVFDAIELRKYCLDRKKENEYEGAYKEGNVALTDLGTRIELNNRLRIRAGLCANQIATTMVPTFYVTMPPEIMTMPCSKIVDDEHLSKQSTEGNQKQVKTVSDCPGELPNLDGSLVDEVLGSDPIPNVTTSEEFLPTDQIFFARTNLASSHFSQEPYSQHEANYMPRGMNPTPPEYVQTEQVLDETEVPDSGALFGDDGHHLQSGASEFNSDGHLWPNSY